MATTRFLSNASLWGQIEAHARNGNVVQTPCLRQVRARSSADRSDGANPAKRTRYVDRET